MTIASLTTFGALPALRISAPDGACAIVTLYGAHLVSWRTADGTERLFCSARSALDGSRAIRGGVPVIFPQFGARGDGLRHGFARVSNWRADASGVADGRHYADFVIDQNDLAPALAAAWPHAFALRLRVALGGGGLDLTLEVHNTGDQAFPFAAALHSYYRVAQLDQASLDGLGQVRFSDDSGADAVQEQAVLRFSDKLDRVYQQVPGALTLATGTGALRLAQQGFADAVVWNPGAADAAALADLADDDYLRFVCVEAALIGPHTLAAGAVWRGVQSLQAT